MAVQISGNDITVPRDGTFSRNVSIAGTLTYEDVTNVDSIGIVTARNGIEVGASPGVAASISVDGNAIFSGITTIGGVINANSDIKVGSGVTVGKDGDIFATGISTLGKGAVIKNTTAGDGDGARSSFIKFQGTQSGGEVSDLVHIGALHDGTGDNQQGAFRVYVNDGDDNAAPTERFGIGQGGEFRLSGANIGSSGQVLTSQGSGSPVYWATPASGWVHAAEVSLNGNSSVTLTGVPDGASHIRYLIRYMSVGGSGGNPMFRVQKSTTGGSKSIITSNYKTMAFYSGGTNNTGSDANTNNMNLFKGWTAASNSLWGSVNVYRIGTNGSDGTNYFFEHVGFGEGAGDGIFQSNGYLELGTSSTDFISGALFTNSNGENFDNGYINQSYLLS